MGQKALHYDYPVEFSAAHAKLGQFVGAFFDAR
jgi:hypothetical protein